MLHLFSEAFTFTETAASKRRSPRASDLQIRGSMEKHVWEALHPNNWAMDPSKHTGSCSHRNDASPDAPPLSPQDSLSSGLSPSASLGSLQGALARSSQQCTGCEEGSLAGRVAQIRQHLMAHRKVSDIDFRSPRGCSTDNGGLGVVEEDTSTSTRKHGSLHYGTRVTAGANYKNDKSMSGVDGSAQGHGNGGAREVAVAAPSAQGPGTRQRRSGRWQKVRGRPAKPVAARLQGECMWNYAGTA